MSWSKEFPSMTGMPEVPPEWTDTSWHNDAMPSFEREIDGRTYRLWVDFPTREESEVDFHPEGEWFRFCVCRMEPGYPETASNNDAFAQFNDFAELEQHLNAVRAGA